MKKYIVRGVIVGVMFSLITILFVANFNNVTSALVVESSVVLMIIGGGIGWIYGRKKLNIKRQLGSKHFLSINYWFLAFFIICFSLNIYYSFVVNQNVPQIYRTGEVQPSMSFVNLLSFIPGFNLSLGPLFATGNIFIGPLLLSLFYGIIGLLIGGLYDKFKNRNKI